jgi:hypothetical protein
MASSCSSDDSGSTVKPPYKVASEISGFDRETEDNLKWRKFNAEIIDLGLLILDVE